MTIRTIYIDPLFICTDPLALALCILTGLYPYTHTHTHHTDTPIHTHTPYILSHTCILTPHTLTLFHTLSHSSHYYLSWMTCHFYPYLQYMYSIYYLNYLVPLHIDSVLSAGTPCITLSKGHSRKGLISKRYTVKSMPVVFGTCDK
jgi:hypothetical protein